MNKMKTLVAVICGVPLAVCAATVSDGVAFATRGEYMKGAVAVQPAQGGEYVYSSRPSDGSRATLRFMMGKPQRDEYDLFSAQEEQALASVRAAELAKLEAAARPHVRHVAHRAKPKLNWPKVVVVDNRTCVPELGHASDSDWQNHLVCWNPGDKRVE